jgi:hypothetical protein
MHSNSIHSMQGLKRRVTRGSLWFFDDLMVFCGFWRFVKILVIEIAVFLAISRSY